MDDGTIIINSDIINTVITDLRSSYVNLESNLISKLPGNFSVLAELGFFSSGINAILSQTNKLVDLHKTLITQISQHLNDYATIEDELSTTLENGLENYSIKNNNYSGSAITSGNLTIDDVEQGTAINKQKLVEEIIKLTDEEKINLINLLYFYKSDDISVVDLLLDNTKSQQLYVVLNNIFGNTNENLSINSYEDSKIIQKILLESICNGTIENTELNTNSILIAKEYLKLIAKENNTDISNLLLNDEYKKTLQISLLNLYDGNNIGKYNLNSQYVDNVRKYIENIAEKNNTTVEDILVNKIDIIL